MLYVFFTEDFNFSDMDPSHEFFSSDKRKFFVEKKLAIAPEFKTFSIYPQKTKFG